MKAERTLFDKLLPYSNPKELQAGFSLLEILIALTLLAIVGTFVAGKFFDQLEEGKVESAKIQINNLASRLKEFRRHCGYYPTDEQGLDALVTPPQGGRECKRYAPGGYLEKGKVPLDPWEGEFRYKNDGRTFDIISLGADGLEGGEGFDADIKYSEI